MMKSKKRKFSIDGVDRVILKSMSSARRQLSSSEIAKKIKYTPSGIRPRLDKLEDQGIIKKDSVGGIRSFKRTFINPQTKKKVTRKINAPRSIKWKIDLKKKRE
jgi:DNA-binding Lrp family transcriptional regulator